MEKPQALTCILCKKQIPAEEHTHHCGDGNYAKIEKLVLPSEMPDSFAITGYIPTKVTCGFCNKNEVSVIKQVTANGEFVPKPMCDDCQKLREIEARELEEENRKNEEKLADAQRKWDKEHPKVVDTENIPPQMMQCEYCGKMFTLTKKDFVEHQDVCKADNAQI